MWKDVLLPLAKYYLELQNIISWRTELGSWNYNPVCQRLIGVTLGNHLFYLGNIRQDTMEVRFYLLKYAGRLVECSLWKEHPESSTVVVIKNQCETTSCNF